MKPPIPIVRAAPDTLAALAAQINLEHKKAEAELHKAETAQAKSLKHAKRCGELLIRAKRRVGHGHWLKWLRENTTLQKSRAAQYMQFARAKGNFQSTGNSTEDEWDKWQKISANKPAFVTMYTKEEEWYTPPNIIEAARAVLGNIDLDPASCVGAQKYVQARRYFTSKEDGLSKKWRGRVWLNPPYTVGLMAKFIQKLLTHFENGDISAALLLTNNNSDTGWYHALLRASGAICVARGRMTFMNRHGSEENALQGQTIFSLGADVAKFATHFGPFGIIMVPFAE